jgi:hypothetical protein
LSHSFLLFAHQLAKVDGRPFHGDTDAAKLIIPEGIPPDYSTR